MVWVIVHFKYSVTSVMIDLPHGFVCLPGKSPDVIIRSISSTELRLATLTCNAVQRLKLTTILCYNWCLDPFCWDQELPAMYALEIPQFQPQRMTIVLAQLTVIVPYVFDVLYPDPNGIHFRHACRGD